VYDPPPPSGFLASGTPPPRVWMQGHPGPLGASLARDITILRRGLDGHVQRQQLVRVSQRRRRLWIAGSGLGLGFLIGMASLFF
jgi:hypothetical protein